MIEGTHWVNTDLKSVQSGKVKKKFFFEEFPMSPRSKDSSKTRQKNRQ